MDFILAFSDESFLLDESAWRTNPYERFVQFAQIKLAGIRGDPAVACKA